MIPVGSDQPIEGRADQVERRYRCYPRHPSPPGEHADDSPPGCEALEQGAIGIPHQHSCLVIAAGQWQVLIPGAAKVDEADARVAIAGLAPRPRGLAETACSVHPDVQLG
jgi:hypothetical protein